MKEILEQFPRLESAHYRIVLQAQDETVLPAIIGSALRGAFGHALKAIACSVPHQDCRRCLLAEACLYTTVFEPASAALKDVPRPFIFEPPAPPLTMALSESSTLKMRVPAGGKIAFDLLLFGETIKRLPYFIYAMQLFARHGLGASRAPFSVRQVSVFDADKNRRAIYTPDEIHIAPHEDCVLTLAKLVEKRLSEIEAADSVKLKFTMPLRVRLNRDELLKEITFFEIFKRISLRLKLMGENYGVPPSYDYKTWLEKAARVRKVADNSWRHNFTRRSNRRETKLEMDGMLGEIEFAGTGLNEFLPFLAAGETLHVGSATSFGLGKYEII